MESQAYHAVANKDGTSNTGTPTYTRLGTAPRKVPPLLNYKERHFAPVDVRIGWLL